MVSVDTKQHILGVRSEKLNLILTLNDLLYSWNQDLNKKKIQNLGTVGKFKSLSEDYECG